MKKNNFLILVLGCMLLFAACQKEQNFDRTPVNKVDVTTDGAQYTVQQLSTLKITPTLTESMQRGDAYTYEWKAYLPLSGEVRVSVPKVLSTKKDLDVVIDLAPGTYNLEYTVSNTTTNLKTFKALKLVVTGAFDEGWLVAHNKAGKASLGFIRANGELTLDAPALINQKTYEGSALSSSYSVQGLITFFTTEGAFRFDPNNFAQFDLTNTIGPKKKFINPAYGGSGTRTEQFLIDEGALYATTGSGYGAGAQLKPYSERLPGTYNFFSAVMNGSLLSTMFYDNLGKKFYSIAYTSRVLVGLPAESGAPFDMSNVGKTAIAYDRGPSLEHLVMEDAGGRYLYSVRFTQTDYKAALAQKINNASTPEFDLATSFATSGVLQQMYYAVGNKIYLYTIPSNSAVKIYEFPAGYNIKDLEMYRVSPLDSKRLAVAVNNGAEGEVYVFDMDLQGLFVGNTFTKKYTGFGNIVHLNYRLK